MAAKSILITGASSGIGAASARAAVAGGWRVALVARSTEKIEALAQELGEAALPIAGDVTKPDDMDRAAQAAVDSFGGLDAAFANAGTGLEGSPDDPEVLRHLVDVNVMGVLFTARAVLPHLQRSGGHLLLTGSAAGRQHMKGSIYGATKWFVHGYGGNMAEQMREWGGRCTVIAPGMVATPFFDEPPADKLQPEDVASAVMHALEAPDRAAVREIYLMPQH